jgi:DNA polymerase
MREFERWLYFDTETFCETPIKDGTHRYSENVEVMIAAWALDDPLFGEGEIVVEDLTDDDGHGSLSASGELLGHLNDPSIGVVIQKSDFDRTVIRKAWGLDLPVERIHDTMVQAMAHGLPGGLDKLSTIFKLGDEAKHAGGKDLIRLFCMPRPKNQKLRRATKHTHPEEWQTFLDYAGGDIRSMRRLRKVMPAWNYPGRPSNHPGEHDTWVLDQKVNDRGFKVDLELAAAAISLSDLVKKRNDEYVDETTVGEVQTANQTQKLLAHLLSYYGVSLPDMQKGTLERRIEDPNLPEVVKELLRARLDTAVASVAKYKALTRSVSDDGRLRGTIQFCGAIRTGRDAGRIFQPQNLVRPNKAEGKAVAGWIDAIKSGAGDLLLANPARAMAVALRGTIIAEEGKKLVVADLANIEGRMIAWLAGERWKLAAFAAYDRGIGHDLYRLTYARSFNMRVEDVTDDQRQIGKVEELALNYQGAVGAFGTMMRLYGLELSDEAIAQVVSAWRDANGSIVQFWRGLEEAAREATLNPGTTTHAGDHIAFHRVGEWLRMRLPSGRLLCYCQPAIVDHPKFAGSTSLSYLGVNSYTRKWERIHTYGGKLAENATQAASRDVLKANSHAVENAGYPIILPVHDELVTEPVDNDLFTTEGLCGLLRSTPWWADEHLPLAAAGFETYRYKKE